MMNAIYSKTVKPVTACVMTFALYTKGYHDSVTDLQLNRPTSFVGIVLGVTESSLLGYSIGITYPISIPLAMIYVYNTKN